MKKQYVVVLALIAAVLVPAAAQAQETRVEFTPYFAWRHGNDVNDTSGIRVNLESGVAYGFMVDVNVTSNVQIEFIYSARRTDGTLFVPPGLPELGPVGTFPFSGDVDYFQGGILYQFDLANPNIKPFVVATLGAASMRPDQVDESRTRFSLSAGIGAKLMVSKHVGVRTEYRIFSTSTDFVGVGGWCDWWGFCYTFLTSQRLYQSQVTAGLIIAF